MKNIINKIIIDIKENRIIKNVLEILDNTSMQIVFIVDNKKLIGTITDGDIRRALLKGHSLDSSIEEIFYKNPVFVYDDNTLSEKLKLLKMTKAHRIPVLNKNKEILDIIKKEEFLDSIDLKDNIVVIMAGGLGTRLHPLTHTKPKPLLDVGSQPILQTIVDQFIKNGFKNFLFSVNYKSHMIKEYFGDGSKYGENITIEYIEEDKRLGTAGALSLIKKEIDKPFFVMNGDILTNINFEALLKFHGTTNAKATMCVREFDFKIPYGVVEVENDQIKSIEEKPVHTFFVNAGIYILEPEVLSDIPKEAFFDMPSLFEKLGKQNKKICSFPIFEYWMDIGHLKDYEQANLDFDRFFNNVSK